MSPPLLSKREIFVHRADKSAVVFGHHAEIAQFRNRAAAGDGHDARPAASFDQAMQLRRDAARRRLECPTVIPSLSIVMMRLNVCRWRFRYGHARRTSVNKSSSAHSSPAHIATICWAMRSSGATGTSIASNRPARTPRSRRQAFDQFIARQGKQSSLGHHAQMRGPTDRRAATSVAIERGEPIWQTKSM